MSTRTLFLDTLILTAATFPSGFSGSVSGVLRVDARHATTSFLIVILAPLLIVFLISLSVRPDLFLNRPPHFWGLLLAIGAAPATLALEWGVHNAIEMSRSGIFQRRIELHDFWEGRRSISWLLVLTLIALGEEIVFRQIWIGLLEQSFGFAAPWALIVSALMYGINHMHFGWPSVLAKSAAGLVYGGLYLFDDRSLWSPFLAHALQNVILLGVAVRRDV
jgi:membrane protease YdiL (CAAX protease family)